MNVLTCFLCRKEYLKNKLRHIICNGTNGFLERLEAIGVNWPENARNISLSCPFSATFRLSSTVFDLKILAHKLSKKL